MQIAIHCFEVLTELVQLVKPYKTRRKVILCVCMVSPDFAPDFYEGFYGFTNSTRSVNTSLEFVICTSFVNLRLLLFFMASQFALAL